VIERKVIMKRIKQINNLIIKLNDATKINYFGKVMDNPQFNTYSVWHGKICLEDRMTLKQAISFATNTKDFIANKA
jgi:hypothetical protein